MSASLTRLFRIPSLAQVTARRGIASKPARSPMSSTESMIGFTTFVVCFLAPSGWVLSNMEAYKKRD
ncbi:cytochrome c oxidase subunit 8B, mitochondrial-like [Pelobates cultripes]|uniref:Cytochrome c oxidase subunit 8B, mitochondrial-like n=1 Tax=Pelobates cultripes TaxID=61616 RepID=A0AAD1WR83_PELCU|nr:cytochrome c oxidase subunit 8B, mitochondrial-like [Pelobates cultripes]